MLVGTCRIWAASCQNQQCGCAPGEDSDQSGPSPSLISVFAARMKKAWVLSYPLSAQRRLWSDWADAQADLSLRWAHTHSVGFVMRRLIYLVLFCSLLSLCSSLFVPWLPQNTSRSLADLSMKFTCMYTCIRNNREQAIIIEPPHDKTNKVALRPAKTQISLIRVFAVRSRGS